jgi:hypothetical protein
MKVKDGDQNSKIEDALMGSLISTVEHINGIITAQYTRSEYAQIHILINIENREVKLFL